MQTTIVTTAAPTTSQRNFYSPYGRQGKLYDANMDRKQAAQIIRKRIKKEFPNIKVSVTMNNGKAIDIEVKAVPFQVYSVADQYKTEYTLEGKNLLKNLQILANEYRYDDSDGMVDYFDTNFYAFVKYDYQLKKVENQVK